MSHSLNYIDLPENANDFLNRPSYGRNMPSSRPYFEERVRLRVARQLDEKTHLTIRNLCKVIPDIFY